mmetsp:Transcript_24304/g.68091  ORF Transcript_24304/g.68091 Transcript_24304/m.68091 type:complete len:226 (+) Transcript_24304:1594-2271(+)
MPGKRSGGGPFIGNSAPRTTGVALTPTSKSRLSAAVREAMQPREQQPFTSDEDAPQEVDLREEEEDPPQQDEREETSPAASGQDTGEESGNDENLAEGSSPTKRAGSRTQTREGARRRRSAREKGQTPSPNESEGERERERPRRRSQDVVQLPTCLAKTLLREYKKGNREFVRITLHSLAGIEPDTDEEEEDEIASSRHSPQSAAARKAGARILSPITAFLRRAL